MAATAAQPMMAQYEDRVVIDDLDWDRYVAISDAVPDRHNPRLIYVDGSLTLVTISRRHDWLAERLGNLVMAVASGLGIVWDDAGSSTFRLRR